MRRVSEFQGSRANPTEELGVGNVRPEPVVMGRELGAASTDAAGVCRDGTLQTLRVSVLAE